MLSNIRENSSGVLAWIVAILIIITMAFFGLSSYVNREPIPVVAEIGNRSIDQSQFRHEFAAWQQQMRQRMGQNQSLDLNSDTFKQNTLNGMINREIIAELVDQNDYVVAEKHIAEAIRTNPQFQTDGKFDQDIYNNYVGSAYRSKAEFENGVRQSLASRQVVSGFGESNFKLDGIVEELASLQAQKRIFDLVSISAKDFEKELVLKDDEVQAYYDANIADFQEEERVSIEYVRLSAKGLENEVTVTDEDLQALYEENRDSYLTGEKRSIRHILFSGENAKQDATEAVENLKFNANFAELAKELSQDPGSAVNGGDLGIVERGTMVPAFDEVAFTLEKDVVSEPVKTEFGYHVIEVTQIDSPKIPSFDEAKGGIKKDEVKRLSEELFFERSDQLKNIVYENPESLQAAIDELDLKLEKTGLFSRTKGIGFTNNRLVRDTAFSDQVLNQNNNSEVIELSSTDVVALRKAEYVEQKPKALQQVRAQISSLLKINKAKEIATTRSQDIYKKLVNGGDSWEAALMAEELTAEEKSASYANASAGLDKTLLDAVFLASIDDKAKQIGRIEGADGNYYLYRLKSIDAVETIEKDVSDSVERLVQSDTGNNLISKFLDSQREKIGVKTDSSLL